MSPVHLTQAILGLCELAVYCLSFSFPDIDIVHSEMLT